MGDRRPTGDHVAVPRGGGAPAVYGIVRRDRRGGVWLQYWLFSAYNPHDRGILRTGRHEGDWEVVQVGLGRDGSPERVTFSQHAVGMRCAWSQVPREGTAPVVFVANGSHALYPRADVHPRWFPNPSDHADGRGRRVRPPLRRPGAWLTWPGRWGNTRAGLVPGEMDSPRGPAFQGDRTTDPLAFHERARPCRTARVGWLEFAFLRYRWAGLALGFLLVAGFLTLRLAERRPRRPRC